MQKAAVVILSWNGKKFLQQFLPSVIAHQKNYYEIFVADNASTDGTVVFLKSNFPSVQIIELKENLGFAHGYNEALKQIEAEYFVLLNQDVEVTADWLKPLIELMEKDKTIAACQPKIKSFHQKDFFEYAGAAGGWIDKYGYPFCRGRIFDTVEKDNGQYDDAAEIFWASGACFFVRAEIFKSMNGFDEEFFAHMEEIDLCWRMKNIGYKIMYCPGSTVYHVGGGSLPQGNPRKTYLNFRNGLIMLAKNLPFWKMQYAVKVRLLLDHLAAYRALLNGNTGDYFAIMKAHFYYLLRKPKWVFRKKNIHEPNMTGFYEGSVVWKYFVKKKKYFSEIISYRTYAKKDNSATKALRHKETRKNLGETS